ncbi:PBSX family phage terminase large subunit [Acetivibrio thermocellus]|uniref:Phage terminase, large subunit, PBSX family n=1 Tax=Acetivibrio thermocellus (strain ATCC 27405 / DSM 1237 / JCM 9322 / NBRC 103400 / NCIMB 10682 / NRRL B-4536 / VPI 7372) TaxID=203119 RepID=A3DI97_ACET2|nr:phage terminase, large subunit, PBSX family [Acetivibrio thermocellus ATCC 27405]
MIVMTQVRLSELVAPSFYEIHNDIKHNRYTHYWLKGGRGSTKSSFVSIEIILGVMKDPNANAVALRKVKETIKDSVFEQLVWAIEKLKVTEYWEIKHNPMELTYLPTGQKILFRGADKPRKIKSIKVSRGYVKFIWYEEVDEFLGMEEIRIINQSLMRGGEQFVVFYTYNPPNRVNAWVNEEILIDRPDRKVHHSTYLTVPRDWLGEQFFIEAEHLKKVNEKAYRHEYLGEVTGTGGEVFTNVKARKINDEEIKAFDRIKRGLDFGYAVDPAAYIVCHFDKTRRRLYIFHEIFQVGLSNRKLAELIKKENKSNKLVVADSAEPKSIAELRGYGINIRGAKKGPDSVEYGIKFLQDLEEIIIDPERCPNTLREFVNYELEKDKDGNFKAEFPDKNNHTIDAVRYALEDDMRTGGLSILK